MKTVLRGLVGIIIIAIGLGVASFLIGLKPEPPVKSPPKSVRLVKTMKATPSNQIPETYIQGRVAALNKIEVFAEVTGVVLPSSKDFRAGTYFQRGETMVRIDGEELKMSLIAQRSGFLQLLTSSLADIKVDYPSSYENWRAYTANLDVNAALKSLPEPVSDQEKFFLSNRGILNQFYAIRSSEERLSKYTLAAPFSGEVTLSAINQGSLVRAGQKLGELVSGNGFEVESAVSRDALQVIAKGDAVSFSGDDGNEYKGTVSRISQTLDPSTQTAKVFCTLDAPSVNDGVYLNGVIYSKPKADVIKLPVELLVDENQVFALKNDSLLELKPVQVVHRSEENILITGLSTGDELLAEPVSGAYSGMTVKVTNK